MDRFCAVDITPSIPNGWNTFEIISSNYACSADSDGMVMRLDCQAKDSARHVIELPLENRSITKQQAGQTAFAALRRAIGVAQPADTSELHGRPFMVHAGVRGTRFRPAV